MIEVNINLLIMASNLSISSAAKSLVQDEAPTFEGDLSRGKEALQILASSLFGKDYDSVLSPAFPASEAFISPKISGVTVGIIPVGSYALGLWSTPEPIRCSVMGTPSNDSFFSLARCQFRKSAAVIVEYKNSEDAFFQLSVNKVSIYLKYHQNPLVTQWSKITDAESTAEVLKGLSWTSQCRFREVEETNNVARTMEDTNIHSYFLLVRNWALDHGLVPHAFNGPTDFEILTLAFEALENSDEALPDESLFLTTLCTNPIDSKLLRSKAAEIGIQELNLSRNKCAILRRVQSRTLDLLSDRAPTLGHSTMEWPHFLLSFEKYIRIDMSCWSLPRHKGGRFVRAIENAIARLLERLIKRYPMALFHPWPESFVQKTQKTQNTRNDPEPAERGDSNGNDFFACTYFIGCDFLDSLGEDPSDRDVFPDDDYISTTFTEGLSEAYQEHSSTYSRAKTEKTINVSEWTPAAKEWGPIPEEKKRGDSSDEESDEEEPELPQQRQSM